MVITPGLIKKCKKGDALAQRVLYNHYKALVMGISRRYGGSREEAEDIFQEAFIRIFNYIGQLKNTDQADGWIKKTTVHTAINHYYRNKRHQHEHGDFTDVIQSNTDYERILEHLNNQQILDLINGLPNGYRMIFNLYAIEGYNHREIGQMLKISENTSKSQLSKARQVLQKALRAMGINKYERYG